MPGLPSVMRPPERRLYSSWRGGRGLCLQPAEGAGLGADLADLLGHLPAQPLALEGFAGLLELHRLARPGSLFSGRPCPNCNSICRRIRYTLFQKRRGNGGPAMRVLIACAIIITTTLGLGGCFGHHEKAVVSEPLKLG